MTSPHGVPALPEGLQVWERGWLSSNNVLIDGPPGPILIDSGYCVHADQTLALVSAALGQRPLAGLINTHLHSDHCGGNAALQARHPGLHTWIPPGHADAVARWDMDVLTYRATGQNCPRFRHDAVLVPGTAVSLGGRDWTIHAAPGHDPHAVLLHEPDSGVLISGDALWENGFGVVFPELDGESAFDEVGATLDLIESLRPRVVIPGHGRPFGGSAVAGALARARSRLRQFLDEPQRHTRYALKVLLKFKLLEWQRAPHDAFLAWARQTPYLVQQHQRHAGGEAIDAWIERLLQDLAASGAARLEPGWVIDA